MLTAKPVATRNTPIMSASVTTFLVVFLVQCYCICAVQQHHSNAKRKEAIDSTTQPGQQRLARSEHFAINATGPGEKSLQWLVKGIHGKASETEITALGVAGLPKVQYTDYEAMAVRAQHNTQTTRWAEAFAEMHMDEARASAGQTPLAAPASGAAPVATPAAGAAASPIATPGAAPQQTSAPAAGVATVAPTASQQTAVPAKGSMQTAAPAKSTDSSSGNWDATGILACILVVIGILILIGAVAVIVVGIRRKIANERRLDNRDAKFQSMFEHTSSANRGFRSRSSTAGPDRSKIEQHDQSEKSDDEGSEATDTSFKKKSSMETRRTYSINRRERVRTYRSTIRAPSPFPSDTHQRERTMGNAASESPVGRTESKGTKDVSKSTNP